MLLITMLIYKLTLRHIKDSATEKKYFTYLDSILEMIQSYVELHVDSVTKRLL